MNSTFNLSNYSNNQRQKTEKWSCKNTPDSTLNYFDTTIIVCKILNMNKLKYSLSTIDTTLNDQLKN